MSDNKKLEDLSNKVCGILNSVRCPYILDYYESISDCNHCILIGLIGNYREMLESVEVKIYDEFDEKLLLNEVKSKIECILCFSDIIDYKKIIERIDEKLKELQ